MLQIRMFLIGQKEEPLRALVFVINKFYFVNSLQSTGSLVVIKSTPLSM